MRKLLLLILLSFLCLTISNSLYSGEDMLKMSLQGIWDFKVDRELKYTINTIDFSSDSKKINVPSCWESEFKNLLDYSGVGWYRKIVIIPEKWRRKRILLKFDAVDYFAEIWINKESNVCKQCTLF